MCKGNSVEAVMVQLLRLKTGCSEDLSRGLIPDIAALITNNGNLM